MSAYLDEQTPHLRSLHSQLSLPPEVLEADLARIEAAIKGVIISIIRERESQVDELKDEIAQAKRDVASLGRAVGDKGRDVVSLSRKDSFDLDTLPNQLAQLTEQMNGLRAVYDERLRHVQSQHATLDRLSALLGPPFQPPKPLQPVASCSKHPSAGPSVPLNEVKKRTSGHTLAQQIAGGKLPQVPQTWYDVGESVTEELDEAVTKALEERDTRRRNLCQTLFNLTWMHHELALPPIPTSKPHNFPPELLPSHEEEETPGAYASFEKLLHKIIALNPLPSGDSEEWPEVDDLEGLEGVEPEVGLIEWVGECMDLWNNVKEQHEARIQELYNLVEPLWTRLEVDQETMDLFVEMNRGSGEGTIAAYEAEYERLLELRRASLSSFIENTRKEIDVLQTELMLSEDEKAEFGAFIDDDYSEELLHQHEQEIERLREEIESKSSLLPKVREWHALVRDEEELERSANDPNRFKMRGGAMLKEEKMRKRVGILKPKIEMELLSLLPTWEEANGRPFLVSGERVVDKIHDEREAKEAAKEAKKRAKQGLAPAKLLPSRQTPAHPSSYRTVSGTSTKPGTASMSTRLGKREAPTPTPSASYQNKKQRLLNTGASSVFGGYGTGTGTMTMGGYGESTMRVTNKTMRSVSASTRSAVHLGNVSPTPMMNGGYGGKGRTMSHSAATMFSSASSSSKIQPMHVQSTYSGLGGGGGGGKGHDLGKADGRRPPARRESFKPRSSILPGMAVGGAALPCVTPVNHWGLVEEDEDVF
ncbi:hypothetical protein I317_07862 [Kwoniella heveanensis CBS 569]|nr:hypothetical protein I317_07862 [Kwoniella heveanensis CBS 569]